MDKSPQPSTIAKNHVNSSRAKPKQQETTGNNMKQHDFIRVKQKPA
jgi:hypothetical protein